MNKAKGGIFAAVAVPALLLTGCAQGAAEVTATPTQSREAAELITCPEIAGPEDAFAFNTKNGVTLSFENQTDWPMTIDSSEIDCFDFSGAANPSVFDGAVVQPGATSDAYKMVVGRVCPWIDGDIIGRFQERSAHWATDVNLEGAGDFNLRTVIDCGSFNREPTMCEGGTSQNKDDYLMDLGTNILRVTSSCEKQVFKITVKTEIKGN